MDLPDRLRRALLRLNGALDALDTAVDRCAEIDEARADADAEFAVMQDDRSRLAVELDAALARSRTLDRALGEVSARLERAEAEVRTIAAELASDDAPGVA